MTVDTDSEGMKLRHACAVCGRVLDFSHLTNEWLHGRQDSDDHPVVPVLAADIQVRARCDFCSAEPVVSFVVSEPVSMVGLLDSPEGDRSHAVPLRYADATWACCVVCDRLIRRQRWSRVTARAVRSMEANGQSGGRPLDAALVDALRQLHGLVAENMIGAPVRYDS